MSSPLAAVGSEEVLKASGGAVLMEGSEEEVIEKGRGWEGGGSP